ncbi:MAG: Clp1/GlmU family protein [Armatimonadota bacterium]|nr:Clp1/GlmU family protein [Armatimonadota bacterium]
MPLHVPEEWLPHIEELLQLPGVTMVIGGVDVGKTTFTTLIANRAFEAGIPVAVIDGDMGQSEIGPPTTVGLGMVEFPIQSLGELHPHALFFVGSTSPVGHLLATATGVKTLVERALTVGKTLIIVDTTGLVRGSVARKLKTHKIELIRPKHLVAIQKATELEHILQFFDCWVDCKVHRLAASPAVKPKSVTLRVQRRATKFNQYFREGQTYELNLESVGTFGTWLSAGQVLEPKYLKFASAALGVDVLHGEMVGRTVYLVTERDYNKKGIEEIQEVFATNSVVVTTASKFTNLIVGLSDKHLELLGLGIVTSIDFKRAMMRIFTPLRSISPICAVRFGVIKLRTDGTEIGRIRPGEI